MILTLRVRITGKVQGVFYRGWTVGEAHRLGLAGWVRNRRDGSVEALFSGADDKVQDMIAACRTGPPAARVESVDTFPAEPPKSPGFQQLETE